MHTVYGDFDFCVYFKGVLTCCQYFFVAKGITFPFDSQLFHFEEILTYRYTAFFTIKYMRT